MSLLTTRQATDFHNIFTRTLRLWAKVRAVPVLRINSRKLLFDREALKKAVKERFGGQRESD